MTSAPDDEPSKADLDAVTAALQAIAPAAKEPDWSALAADIGRAVDAETARLRRRRRWLLGGVVLAAAAVAALLVWPEHERGSTHTASPTIEEEEIDEAEVEDELALPDDLGGITVDDELIDEAAAALDEDTLDDEADELDDRLLPDGAWIDDLSDEDLERVVEILDGEAG